MIDFRRKEMVGPSLVFVGSVVVLLGTFLFMAYTQFINPPSTKGLTERVRKESLKLEQATKVAKESYEASHARVVAGTWEGTPKQVAPRAMSRVSELARKNGVKMTAFRPQRESDAGPLIAAPYLLTLEGTFIDVVRLTQAIDKPGTKLSVNLVQINTSGDDSTKVSATVGITAYLKPEAIESKASSPKSTPTEKASRA